MLGSDVAMKSSAEAVVVLCSLPQQYSSTWLALVTADSSNFHDVTYRNGSVLPVFVLLTDDECCNSIGVAENVQYSIGGIRHVVPVRDVELQFPTVNTSNDTLLSWHHTQQGFAAWCCWPVALSTCSRSIAGSVHHHVLWKHKVYVVEGTPQLASWSPCDYCLVQALRRETNTLLKFVLEFSAVTQWTALIMMMVQPMTRCFLTVLMMSALADDT